MTDQQIKQKLLMSHCYTAFDSWGDAWDDTVCSLLPRMEELDELSKEDRALYDQIERCHNELCDQELYAVFENNIEALAQKMVEEEYV